MCRTRAAAPGSSISKMGRMGSGGQRVSMICLEGLHRSNASHQATGIASRQQSSWENWRTPACDLRAKGVNSRQLEGGLAGVPNAPQPAR